MEPLYRTLNANEIRLLELLPSQDPDADLDCQLVYTSLSHPRKYECLSYVWGVPNLTKSIILNGKQVFVTVNLDVALHRIRQRTTTKVLWIDALCINQNDLAERSQQVSLMKEIYENCETDLVWMLSPSTGSGMDSDISAGLKTIKMIHKNDIDRIRELESPWTPWDMDDPYMDEYEKFFQSEADANDQKPLDSLFRFNYEATRGLKAAFRECKVWNRVWITQELSCSPKIRLLAPDFELDWEEVSSFLDDKKYHNCIGTTIGGHDIVNISLWTYVFETANTIQYQRQIVQDSKRGGESALLNTLVRFRCTQATDPRDKVYGLLGLIHEPHDIKVDYQKSTQEVFTEASLAAINSSGNVDIICQNYWYTSSEESRLAGLPSWAADFTQTQDLVNLYQSFLYGQRSVFCAGRQSLELPCRVVDNVMRLRGTSLGRITYIPEAEDDSNYFAYGKYKIQVAKDWMKTISTDIETKAYVTEEPLFRAFWRTIAMDCKAYPIQRLEYSELDEDEARISRLLQGHFDSAEDPICWGVLERNIRYWNFCTINDTYFGMVLRDVAQVGDEIVVLDGGRVPVILRPHSQGPSAEKTYTVVHVAYVHGFMDGQVKDWVANGRMTESEFLVA